MSFRLPEIANVVGCGSTTSIRSSLSIPSRITGSRVIEFAACPHATIARTLSGWSSWSFGDITASNHRVLGMPFASISFLDANRDTR